MNKRKIFTMVCMLFIFVLIISSFINAEEKINLPPIKIENSLHRALNKRRSIRDFRNKSLKFSQISMLLWAAYGRKMGGIDAITSATHMVASPNELYPLKIYLMVTEGGVEDLKAGLYSYQPDTHTLEKLTKTIAIQRKILNILNSQRNLKEAPVFILIGYDKKISLGRELTFYEVGLSAQNIHLICEDLGIGTVIFTSSQLEKILNGIFPDIEIITLMPVGYPKWQLRAF